MSISCLHHQQTRWNFEVIDRQQGTQQENEKIPISAAKDPGHAPETGRFPMGHFLGFEHGTLSSGAVSNIKETFHRGFLLGETWMLQTPHGTVWFTRHLSRKDGRIDEQFRICLSSFGWLADHLKWFIWPTSWKHWKCFVQTPWSWTKSECAQKQFLQSRTGTPGFLDDQKRHSTFDKKDWSNS